MPEHTDDSTARSSASASACDPPSSLGGSDSSHSSAEPASGDRSGRAASAKGDKNPADSWADKVAAYHKDRLLDLIATAPATVLSEAVRPTIREHFDHMEALLGSLDHPPSADEIGMAFRDITNAGWSDKNLGCLKPLIIGHAHRWKTARFDSSKVYTEADKTAAEKITREATARMLVAACDAIHRLARSELKNVTLPAHIEWSASEMPLSTLMNSLLDSQFSVDKLVVPLMHNLSILNNAVHEQLQDKESRLWEPDEHFEDRIVLPPSEVCWTTGRAFECKSSEFPVIIRYGLSREPLPKPSL